MIGYHGLCHFRRLSQVSERAGVGEEGFVYTVFEDGTAAVQVLSGLARVGHLQSRYQLAQGHISRGAACWNATVLMCYHRLIPFCFNINEIDRFLATL